MANILVAVLVGLSLGLQWSMMQSVAWATMLVERSVKEGFAEAVRTTFDGRHPCQICRVVRHGVERQQKGEESVQTVKKIDLALPRPAFVADLLVMSRPMPERGDAVVPTRPETPVPPPPRSS